MRSILFVLLLSTAAFFFRFALSTSRRLLPQSAVKQQCAALIDAYLNLTKDALAGNTALNQPIVRSEKLKARVSRNRSILINDADGRLSFLQARLDELRRDSVGGDWLEAGVWRGGVPIFASAYFRAHRYFDVDRVVWMADSFKGVPTATWDRDVSTAERAELARQWRARQLLDGGVEQVRRHFDAFGFGAPHWGSDVRALVGYFNVTLPRWVEEFGASRRLAYLRVDCDLYMSTFQALDALYPFVSVGGIVELDDYTTVPQAAEAVDDYRRLHGINEPLVVTTHLGVYQVAFWRKRY